MADVHVQSGVRPRRQTRRRDNVSCTRSTRCFRITGAHALASSDGTPTVAGLTKLMSRQCGEDATSVWQQMRAHGLQPDSFAFTAYAKALAQSGHQRDALRLLDHARRADQLCPALFAVLLKAAGEAGSLDDVLMLESILSEKCIPREEAVHGALVAAYVKHEKISRAEEALQVGRTAQPPHERCGVRAYTPLMQWYASRGEVERAFGVLRTLRNDGFLPTKVTMSALVDGFASAGKLDEAERAMAAMKADCIKPNAITYNGLVKGFLRSRHPPEFERALSLWDEMRSEGIPPSTDTYNVVLEAYLRTRRTQDAFDLLRQMEAQQTAPPNCVTYTTLIQSFAEEGHWKAAHRTFRDLKRLEQPDVIAYNALLHAFARAARWRRCEVVLRAMNVTPDVVTFQELAWAHSNAGRPNAALGVVRVAHEHGIVPDERLYGMLLLTAVRAKLYEKALALLAEMEADGVMPLANSEWRERHWEILQKLAKTHGSSMRRTQQTASGALQRLRRWMGVPSSEDEFADNDSWRDVIRAKRDLPAAIEQQYAGVLEQGSNKGGGY